MGELRASLDGCEVSVTFDPSTEIPAPVRDALVDLAEAIHEQRLAGAEVAGYSTGKLDLGGLRTSVPVEQHRMSCWWFDFDTDSCGWFSADRDRQEPRSCTIYTF